MRAVVLRNGALVVDDLADPVPELGQVLVEVKACGICGSDLHFLKHGDTMVALSREMQGAESYADEIRLDRDLFMGHEFSAEVVAAGPDTIAPPAGTLVTSIPAMVTMTGIRNLAYTNEFPAGYGELMLLSAPLLAVVPNGLDAGRAALTEPMAVGWHAVNKSGVTRGDGALVVGCGPVGLAVIASLRLRGIEPIVAVDPSLARRRLALTMGAHEVSDPAVEPAFDAWARAGQGLPLVAFEAVGVAGMIDEVMRAAPAGTRIVVVGVCMQRDAITPFFGIGKELSLQFVLAYDPMEFAASLEAIADGRLDVAPLITGHVGLNGVAGAFDELAQPDRHCKILVEP
jgi:threonine dehydrogenase-like Zn-dependent dehydrogenase